MFVVREKGMAPLHRHPCVVRHKDAKAIPDPAQVPSNGTGAPDIPEGTKAPGPSNIIDVPTTSHGTEASGPFNIRALSPFIDSEALNPSNAMESSDGSEAGSLDEGPAKKIFRIDGRLLSMLFGDISRLGSRHGPMSSELIERILPKQILSDDDW